MKLGILAFEFGKLNSTFKFILSLLELITSLLSNIVLHQFLFPLSPFTNYLLPNMNVCSFYNFLLGNCVE